MNAAIARAYSGKEPSGQEPIQPVPTGRPCLGDGKVTGCLGQAVADVFVYTPGYLARQGVPESMRYLFYIDLCENCTLLYGAKISSWARAIMPLLHCTYRRAMESRDEARSRLLAVTQPAVQRRRGELESITSHVHQLTISVGQELDGGIVTYIDATGLRDYGHVVVHIGDSSLACPAIAFNVILY